MNSDEILTKIKQRGYYQITQRPSSTSNNLSFSKLEDVIKTNQVRHRGLYYPHVADHRFGKFQRVENFLESFHLYRTHVQIWRFYKSGQFRAYLGLPEDRWDDHTSFGMPWNEKMESKIPNTKFLEPIMIIYQMTEIWLFALRLSKILNNDCIIEIRLRDMLDRKLEVHDSVRRGGFDRDYVCHTETIALEPIEISAEDLQLKHDDLAIQQTLEIFDYFGWNTSHLESLLKDEQKQFYLHSF